MKTSQNGLCLLLLLVVGATACAKEPSERAFEFNYGAVLKDLPESADVRVWVPVPQSSEHQKVAQLSADLPGKSSLATEGRFGNQILYFEPNEPGDFDFRVSYLIKRKELLGLAKDEVQQLTPQQKRLFLSANEMVPLDGKPKELIAKLALGESPLEIGKQLYFV